MERVEKPTSTGTLEGGFVRDGRAKEKNKKSRSRGGDDVVVVDDDDDDGISGSRLVVADVPAPGILFFGFFRRAGERKNDQRWKSAVVLGCPAVSSLYSEERGGRILAALCRKMKLIDNFLKMVLVNLSHATGFLCSRYNIYKSEYKS